jgi:hypothetical protein
MGLIDASPRLDKGSSSSLTEQPGAVRAPGNRQRQAYVRDREQLLCYDITPG